MQSHRTFFGRFMHRLFPHWPVLPPEYREEYRAEADSSNVRRVEVVALILLALSFFFLYSDYRIRDLWAAEPRYRMYPLLDLGLALACGVFYLASAYLRKAGPSSGPAPRVLTHAAITFLLLWCAAVNGVELSTSGAGVTFIIGVFAAAAAFDLGGPALLAMYLAGAGCYYGVALGFEGESFRFFPDHMYLVGLLALAWGVSRILHAARIKSFVDRRKLSETNRALKEEIAERRKAQEALQAARDELESRVEQRTEALKEKNRELLREIRERRKVERERRRLVTAIEQAAEAIVVTDGELRVNYVNAAFERMTGVQRDEAAGRLPAFFRGAQDDLEGAVRGELSENGFWSGRFSMETGSGGMLEAEATFSGVSGFEDGVNYVGVIRDVTREGTLERELRESQKMRALGTLAGGIAHDFNNVLAAILGYADLALHEHKGGGPVKEYLQEVLNGAGRAKELVAQILTFSRRRENEMQSVNLAALTREALRLMRASLPSTVEIRAEIDEEAGEATADPSQIHQVIMNLCSNAAHAMKAKGGILSVKLSRLHFPDCGKPPRSAESSSNTWLRLDVSDTGHGMEAEVRERIFEPYFSTKPPSEGTGLGLAVVHGIVENHGGAIEVYSRPGQGTTFRILLPAVASPELDAEAPARAEQLPATRGNERILVVDDEQALLKFQQEALKRLGYNVEVCPDPVKALEVFRSADGRFDLVITDMTMPHMTGVDLAEAIARERPEIPVILCTGYSEAIGPEARRKNTICAFLDKPVRVTELSTAVRNALDNQPRQGGGLPA
jgi:PAS domain S-box-containing protein